MFGEEYLTFLFNDKNIHKFIHDKVGIERSMKDESRKSTEPTLKATLTDVGHDDEMFSDQYERYFSSMISSKRFKIFL